jgi:ABC-2 type transport system permease protein
MNAWRCQFARELRRIVTDKRIAVTMLGGPLLYAFLFGGVYSAGRISHVPIVIVDQDNSALSRDLSAALVANENLSLAFCAESPEVFVQAARRDRAYACVVFPQHFQRDVTRGDGGRVTVLYDGSNILIGNMTSRTIAGIISAYRVGARSRRLMASGMPRHEALEAAMPIQPVVRPLFNPASHYGFFVLVGLVAVAMQQVIRMGSAIALNLDDGPRDEIKAFLSARVAATTTAVLPFALIAMRLPFDVFGVPFRGSWGASLVIVTWFVVMQILIGYGIAGVFRSALLSLQFLLFASVPLFALSGFTWPAAAMPSWVRAVSWFVPLTHLLDLLRKMALMGAGPASLWPHAAVLAIWMVPAILFARWAFRKEQPQRRRGTEKIIKCCRH